MGTDAIRIDAARIEAVRTVALFVDELLTEADEIELTGIVADRFCVVIGVLAKVAPTGAT